jgi:hypothetical protein
MKQAASKAVSPKRRLAFNPEDKTLQKRMSFTCIVTNVSEESAASISVVEERKTEASGFTEM